MKEWFEANQEIYAEFKSKIHSTLDIHHRMERMWLNAMILTRSRIGGNGSKGYAS